MRRPRLQLPVVEHVVHRSLYRLFASRLDSHPHRLAYAPFARPVFRTTPTRTNPARSKNGFAWPIAESVSTQSTGHSSHARRTNAAACRPRDMWGAGPRAEAATAARSAPPSATRGPRVAEAEVRRPQRQRRRRGAEHAHADRLRAVPQQDHAADEGEAVRRGNATERSTASRTGCRRRATARRRSDHAFSTPRRSTSTRPSPWQRTHRSGVEVVGDVVVRGRGQHPDPGRAASFRRLNATTFASGRSSAAVNSSATGRRPTNGVGSAVASAYRRAGTGIAGRRSAPPACGGAAAPRRARTRRASPAGSSTGPGARRPAARPGSSAANTSRAELLPHLAQQRRLPDSAGPVNSTRSPGRMSSVRLLRDDVRRLLLGEAEQVGDVRRGQAAAGRAERVADGDGGQHGAPRFRAGGWVRMMANTGRASHERGNITRTA